MAQDVSHIFQDEDFKKKYYQKIGGKGQRAYTFESVRNVAQQHGFCGNDLNIFQSPSKENENVAIVLAKIYMLEPDGKVRSYTGLGDASPANLTKQTSKAIPRMAETRAMARAFRNALQIGEAVYEEFDVEAYDEDEVSPKVKTKPKPQSNTKDESWDEEYEIELDTVIETKDDALKEINRLIKTKKITGAQVKGWASEIIGTENLRDESITFDQVLEVLDKVEIEFDLVTQQAS